MSNAIITTLKVTLITSISLAFMLAIGNFLNFLIQITFGGVVSEVFQLISVCLPFNANAVFGSMLTAFTAIGSFMVANKLWSLLRSLLYVV